MERINEYDIEPGTYQHYKGGLYVVVELVTHVDGPDGKMRLLDDPLVVYRDLVALTGHDIKGKPGTPYRRYARPLSEFSGYTNEGIKRFKIL